MKIHCGLAQTEEKKEKLKLSAEWEFALAVFWNKN
jgi:hypothetical protein